MFITLIYRFLFLFMFFDSSVNFLDDENFVLVHPVVDRQFAGLAEGLVAPGELALVGLISSVHVQVVLEILSQGEALPAEVASEAPARVVGRDVPSQAILIGIFFVTVPVSAGESSM